MRDKTIAILESRLGQQMVELVAKHGGVPFHAPALAEVADVDPAFVAELVRKLETRAAKVAIFQTGVGTRALFAATDALGLTVTLLKLLAASIIAVRGPKPTAALRSRDVRIDISARDPFTTHEVLEALQAVPVASERVIVQRYGVTNTELEEALKARGAEIIEIPTYRWALPENTQPLIDVMDRYCIKLDSDGGVHLLLIGTNRGDGWRRIGWVGVSVIFGLWLCYRLIRTMRSNHKRAESH